MLWKGCPDSGNLVQLTCVVLTCDSSGPDLLGAGLFALGLALPNGPVKSTFHQGLGVSHSSPSSIGDWLFDVG